MIHDMPTCGQRHDEVITQLAKATALSEELNRQLPGLFARMDTHLGLDGHPLALARLAGIESRQAKTEATLEKVGASATQACVELTRIAERHDKEDAERAGVVTWLRDKLLTPVIVAVIVGALAWLRS